MNDKTPDSRLTSVYDCSILELNRHHSDRQGDLCVVENSLTVPFDVRRVYYLYDVPGGESRGGHAHRALKQLIVAAGGSLSGAVCMVLASELYDPEDYIEEYVDFLAYKGKQPEEDS